MSGFSVRSLIVSLAAAAAVATVAPAANAQFGSAGGAQAAGVTTAGVTASAPAAPSAPAQAPVATARQYSAAVPATAMLQQILDATNAFRAANHVAPVRYNAQLATIAQDWSAHQAAVDTMYHNPDLRTLYPAGWTAFGENVLQNWDDATAAQLVQQWIDSPAHRAAMLNPDYTDLGLGYAVTTTGKVYATQDYARF